MINNKVYKTKFQIFLEYIFILLTIFQCNSMYYYQGSHNELIINLLWQSLLIVLVFIAFSNTHFRIIGGSSLAEFLFLFTLIMILYFILESIYYPSFQKIYIFTLIIDPILIIIYFFSYKFTNYFNSLLYEFENIMIILAVISLFFWALSNINFPTNYSPIIHNFFGNSASVPSYFDIGFSSFNKSNMFGFNLVRNTGIFTEPSMYGYSLNIALFIGLFIRREKIFTKNILILFFTMLSVFSTTGIVFSVIAIIYKFMISHNIKKIYKVFSIIFVPILLIFLDYIVNNKINNSSALNETSSYSTRTDDMTAGIKAWKDHIVMGNGLGNLRSVQNYIAPWRIMAHRGGISAGFTTILAFGGIIFALFYVLPVVCSCVISPFIRGFAIFSFLLIVFVFIQNRYECIMIISYLWSDYIYHYTDSKKDINNGLIS